MEISALVVMLDAFDGGKRKYLYIFFNRCFLKYVLRIISVSYFLVIALENPSTLDDAPRASA